MTNTLTNGMILQQLFLKSAIFIIKCKIQMLTMNYIYELITYIQYLTSTNLEKSFFEVILFFRIGRNVIDDLHY